LNSEDPAVVLHALAQLDVSQLPAEDVPAFAQFWASKVVAVLRSLGNDFGLVRSLLGVARVAVNLKSEGAVVAVLDGRFEGIASSVPERFPVLAKPPDISGDISAIVQFVNNSHAFRLPSNQEVLRRSLLFSSLVDDFSSDVIALVNSDYYVDAGFTFEEAAQLSVIRYLFERFVGSRIERPRGPSDAPIGPETPIAHFVYYSFRKAPFDPKLDIKLLFLALVNAAVLDARVNARPSPSQILASKFVPALGVDPNFCKTAFRIATSIVADCLPELDVLVIRAVNDDQSAAIKLLGRPDCLPLLTNRFRRHRLLMIFAQPRGNLLRESVEFEMTVEATAEFVWRYRLPDDPAFLSEAANKLHQLLGTQTKDSEILTAFFGTSSARNPRVLRAPKDYFAAELTVLDFLNTYIWALVSHIKVVNGKLDVNVLSDFATHSYLSEEVRQLAGPVLPSRRAFWAALILDRDPSQAKIPQDVLGLVYRHVLRFNDSETLLRLRRSVSLSQNWEIFGESLLSATLLLANDRSHSDVVQILVQHSSPIDLIWRLLRSRRDSVAVELVRSLRLDNAIACQIIESISEGFGTTPPGIVAIVNTLLPFIPRRMFQSGIELEQGQSLDWDEDSVATPSPASADDSESIPFGKPVKPGCVKSADGPRVGYYCYTCSERPDLICLNCAVHCHPGHFVTFGHYQAFTCKCSRVCDCGHAVAPSPPQTLRSSTLVKLFIALAGVDWEKSQHGSELLLQKTQQITSRLTRDIRTIPLRSLNRLNCPPSLSIELIHPPILQPRSFSNLYSDTSVLSLFQRRATHGLLNLVDASPGFLFIAAGDQVRVHSPFEFRQISAFQVMNPIALISVRKRNDLPLLVAVGSVRSFEVFAIGPKGEARRLFFHLNKEPSQFLLAIDWIHDDFLSALWDKALELYPLQEATENVAPFEKYVCGNEVMTSCVVLEHNFLTFVLIACHSGKLYLEPIFVGAGPVISLRTMVVWQSEFVSINVSVCYEANLFFIAAPGTDLRIYRIEDLFSGTPTAATQIDFEGSSGELKFVGTVPRCPSILLFVHPQASALFALEITNTSLEVSRIRSPKAMRLFDHDHEVYGFARLNDQFVIIAGDGSISSLSPTSILSPDETFDEFEVPLTFWSSATVATMENSEITGTDTTQDYNTLYHDSVAFFHTNVREKVLTFHVKDPTLAIVGFMLSFGHHDSNQRPPYAMLKGRKYETRADRNHMFVLMPHEVRPGEKVSLSFPARQDRDIVLQSAAIFVVKADQIAQFLTACSGCGWLTRPRHLLEFWDAHKHEKTPAATAYRVVMAITPTAEEVLDEALIRKVVEIMYSRPELAMAARSIMVRLATVRKEVLAHWAEGLKSTLESRKVAKELWEAVWRDFALFPSELHSQLQELVWEVGPATGSIGAILAAFAYLDP
jgi:hypothetical protein